MPMQKTTTPQELKKTEILNEPQTDRFDSMEPRKQTLNRILQFAATYRAQKINDSQAVEWFLN